MSCSFCFHSNFSSPPGDDLEAACPCDCHFECDEEEEGVCTACERDISLCTCYGENP